MTAENEGRAGETLSPELKKERDAFIQSFFQKGAQLTQDLVNENLRLRHRVAELEQNNAQLLAQVKSDDAIRELLKKIDLLEKEKAQLVSHYRKAEAESSRWVGEYAQIESELANFANLYVASHQLHSSLGLASTVRRIKELLEQLMGARVFAVYLATSDGRRLAPIVTHGFDRGEPIAIKPDDGGIGEVFTTGVARIEAGDLSRGSMETPLALVPMRTEDKVIGVLAVFSTLEQKPKFLPVDFELFKMLGEHAGGALIGARLFADAGQRIPNFDSLLNGVLSA
jgi:GAF domain-containing protein